MCQVVSGGRQRQINRVPRGCSWAFVCGLSSPVLGLHLVGRLTSGRFCRVCPGTGDFLRPQGAIPPGFYPLRGGWIYCLAPEVPKKGECRRGRRYFWPCQTPVGFDPATGPTLKTALCHIRALVGCIDKYQRSTRTISGATRLHEARVLRYRGFTHLTTTSSGKFNNLFLRSFLRAMRGLLRRVGASLAVHVTTRCYGLP